MRPCAESRITRKGTVDYDPWLESALIIVRERPEAGVRQWPLTKAAACILDRARTKILVQQKGFAPSQGRQLKQIETQQSVHLVRHILTLEKRQTEKGLGFSPARLSNGNPKQIASIHQVNI